MTPVTKQATRPKLKATGIEFGYEGMPVLDGTELEVRDGEVLALVGPNGGGKTTLLRVLAGLERPARGAIELDGVDITKLPAESRVARDLVVVFGGTAVFGDLSVTQNLLVGGELIFKDRRVLADRVQQQLDTFPRLRERQNALAAELSGGEQQMLAIGKAFMAEPKVLCIDELSLGLAPALVSRLLGVLRRQNESGTTLVLVEPSVNVALEIADRVAYFERGRVVSIEDADVLRSSSDLLHRMFFGERTGADA